MKACTSALFLNLAITASLLYAAPSDTVFNVKVYACKHDSGDCRRIIWNNHLADIPYDSVQSTYPVYIVILFHIRPPDGWAMGPDVMVGNERAEEYGSWGGSSTVFWKLMRTCLCVPALPTSTNVERLSSFVPDARCTV
ncbi:MAG: hypothetical protein JW913_08125 [Chitinispirillaceae bacterium]|nr:hypothetical protein [Chitinispirillaceae bacterium]